MSNPRTKSVVPPHHKRSYSVPRPRQATQVEEVEDADMAGSFAAIEFRHDSDEESEEDGKVWEFEPDLGEFVDNEGGKWYQVTWTGWRSKKTGRSATWVEAEEFKKTASLAAETHERKERRRRQALASKSTAIDIAEVCSRVWHSVEDREIKAALMEKLQQPGMYDTGEDWSALPEAHDEDHGYATSRATSRAGSRSPSPASSPAPVRAKSAPRSVPRASSAIPTRVSHLNGRRHSERAPTPPDMPYPIRTRAYKEISSARGSAAASTSSAFVTRTASVGRSSRLLPRPGDDPFAAGKEVISLSEDEDDDDDDEDEHRRGIEAKEFDDEDDEDVVMEQADDDGIRRGNRVSVPPAVRPPPLPARPPPIPSSEATSSRSSSSRQFRPHGKRADLQAEWDKKTNRAGAARILICGKNANDRESIPELPPRFVWLENEYVYPAEVIELDPRDVVELDFNGRVCLHGGDCTNPPSGECCARTKRTMHTSLAYDDEGRWRFLIDKHIKVVECNKFCECDKSTCPHSIAQRPRQHVLELFDTGTCGWGVRTPKALPKGTVLGLFTGELITRAVAEERETHLEGSSSYVFDLDHDERQNDDSREPSGYSVDARTCGNWTRFVNHSCAPNLDTYTVQFDAPHPGEHPGKLVFVTSKNISAGTQLTLDYSPQHDVYAKRPDGHSDCHCGAMGCRGWM